MRGNHNVENLNYALPHILELCSRLSNDDHTTMILTEAISLIGKGISATPDDEAKYKKVVIEYLNDATEQLQRIFDRHKCHISWVGTISYFSRIIDNPYGPKRSYRISHFHNTAKDESENPFQIPVFYFYDGPEGDGTFSVRVSKDDDKAEDLQNSVMHLLNYLHCPPANLVAYFGHSISISCSDYLRRLFGKDYKYGTKERYAELCRLFDCYQQLRHEGLLDSEAIDRLIIHNYCLPFDLAALRSARMEAITPIRLFPRGMVKRLTLNRASRCEWPIVDKVVKTNGWGFEILLEPLFPIASLGGDRLNVYFAGLRPIETREAYADVETLYGLFAVCLFKSVADELHGQPLFHQIMGLFSDKVMSTLSQIELLAKTLGANN
jgi:hypothetical protein